MSITNAASQVSKPQSGPTPAAQSPSSPPAQRSHREILVVMSGLVIAMLLAMLDNMIVSTAMPTIVGELHGLSHLAWVVTAYILASTAATPIWGKLGDLYGRKGMFMASIAIFLAGSALSGAAQNMSQLIGFRAVQGLGAGGLMVGAIAIIGDLVPPRERGRYQGVMAAVMPLAMIGGPLVGGFITEHLSWRWAFYVNLPLGAVALVVVALTMHLPRRRVRHRIDYAGAALLTAGITSLVLTVSWGGSQYAWASRQIVGLGIVALVSLVAFILVERRVTEPILPLSLFRNRNFVVVSILGFLSGLAMFGAVSFLPLYQQSVQGASATNSGLLLLPLMTAALAMSLLTGQLITRTGRYKIFPILGGAGLTIGALLLSQLGLGTSRLSSGLFMVVLGLGLGFLMQTTMLVAQNSAEQRHIGVASSTAAFFRSIGGSIGVALLGAVFTSRLQDTLVARLGENGKHLTTSGAALTPSLLDKLPGAVRDAYLHAIVSGIRSTFLWAVAFAVLAFVVAWFLTEVPLRGGVSVPDSSPTEKPGAAEKAARASQPLNEPASQPGADGPTVQPQLRPELAEVE